VLEILYRDDAFVVVNKPSGLVVHRSRWAADRDNCLVRLRDQLGQHVHPVHRLDRGTSGALVFALSREHARRLFDAFAAREIEKEYVAIVRGFAPDAGTIDHPLSVEHAGPAAEARTCFRRVALVELPLPVGRYPTARFSFVVAEPLTGRTHQLRRHFAHISHPILGDVNHGDGRQNRFFRERFELNRLALHASRIRFEHPLTRERIEAVAPLPAAFAEVVRALGWEPMLTPLFGLPSRSELPDAQG
jgi:tRNA pseudouridine65 synthase